MESIVDLMDFFNDEKECEKYLQSVLWKDSEYCPYCGTVKIYHLKGGKRFRCSGCKKDFSIKTGTIFHDSKIPLRKWFLSIYLLTTHKKSMSSYQLARDMKVTQKTAYYMLQRIREAVKNENFLVPMNGTVEQKLLEHVNIGSRVISDEWHAYKKLNRLYDHESINHSKNEYARGDVHTNTIEGFWAIMKRSIYGIHHFVTPKHLQRYINEQTFRYNNRGNHSAMFNMILSRIGGKKLSYKELTRNL